MTYKKVLVLGASPNRARYSNMAAYKLLAYGHHIILVGKKNGFIQGQPIQGQLHKEFISESSSIDTVTIYLNAQNQKEYYNDILKLKPKRIIFNPGAENPELAEIAQKNGIHTEEACTLVLLSSGLF
jgi:predicted CoA-binding protein